MGIESENAKDCRVFGVWELKVQGIIARDWCGLDSW